MYVRSIRRQQQKTPYIGDTMDTLYRPIFNTLSVLEKKLLLKEIPHQHLGFSFKRFEKFERFSQATETAVYEFGHSEFVFVPGDTITLGWDSFAMGMDEITKAALLLVLSEYGINDLESFLKKSMSPVRTVKVGPLLVERNIRDIGWQQLPLTSPKLTENPALQKLINDFQLSSLNEYSLHNSLRLKRIGQNITADLYTPVSYSEFIATLETSGFRLPTEDEWEYLCGGGSRGLFRWGDCISPEIHLYYRENTITEKTKYYLQLPNQFGIRIAYDPYKYEVLMDNQFLKGGDGGCYLCGGSGLALGYLPVSTYFRDTSISNNEHLDHKEDIGGDCYFYRRIIRL